MDLSFTAEEQAFRDEVRTFLQQKYPRRLADKVRTGKRLTKADHEEWHAILNARGWLASHWPVEHGGTGWTPVQSFIFDTECALANTPRIVPFGLSMLGPVLIKFGSEAQKRHWLPRILDGSDWWSQGYSEPGAGSDLAAVKTTAVPGRDEKGDHYIVNGQKTWTTMGQHGNMLFCLVRTDPKAKKQEGISFLLVDMKSPGVEVRPIVTLDGDREVNEVFLTDVRVPADNLVWQENKGWTCAKYLLTYERTNIAGVGGSMAALGRLKAIAAKQMKNGRALADDPAFAARMARVEIELENMKTTNLRVLAAVEGGGAPGAESSMLKIRGTQIQQELSSLYRRAMGPYALPYIEAALEDEGYDAPPVGPPGAAYAGARYFNLRKTSIYGGSNEVQRNIISKMILGL
ncbi:MAG TPA: acyl-CoA dehydrogenase family protein [Rubrivivax sp.]|nr:acyl-CoA dehydrogenase family protein [Rubrivivax sp.]